MIWIVAFFIIILVSAVLAFRSMKDYEEFPNNLSLNTVFFIGNPQNLTAQSLKKLHSLFIGRKQFFSLERLNKGKERALVIFGPRDLPEILSELNLVEIEDYLASQTVLSVSDKLVNVNQTFTWLIEPKINNKKQLHVGIEIKDLQLGDRQKFFIQIICVPESHKGVENFQATLRVMVVDEDPMEKVALAKKIKTTLEIATGLNIHEDNFPEQKKFESFKQRSLVPKEVTQFTLNEEEIYSLIS
jgi:hypothetical protein